ncbi:amidase [Breoghania sp. L-A4]|uniref:amidase n=1 Tax=Breoghania sp. L-A4 TaxID=2304600 RepID=UPI000E35CC09|nr:amidase [Breoghania sp. L-A4]AXS41517.1 amidase [Breoghania sp. L-A4]
MRGFAEYETFDAIGLAGLVARREVSAAELLDAALARAHALNPQLNALTMLQEDAARRLAVSGAPEGPLSGVPFLLKDLGGEAVDFPANNGSVLLKGIRYPRNSTLIDRLLASGLVVFGRTTAPEGGVGAATEAAVYGGPTRNPWNLDRTPGGSSGGSGAVVAAGIVPAAHGSDGGGSVRIPASCCGLFGFKPTRARLPEGPYAGEGWAGMATEGFLTRSVRDTALLLDLTAGGDLGAPYCAPPMRDSFMSAAKTSCAPLRIALCTTTLTGDPIDPECRAAVEDAARLLESLGHHVESARPLNANTNGMMRAWTDIVACGTTLWVRQALAAKGRALLPGDLENVALSACEHAKTISGDAYLEAIEKIHMYGREMAEFFVDYDALLTATLAEPPARIGRFAHTRESYLDYRLGPDGIFNYSPFTASFNATGQPAASVPLHWSAEGLPVGAHLAGRFGEDEMLMSLCADLERARPWFGRRPPVPVRTDAR